MNRQKIEDVLIKMGIPVSIKGFQYIVDAVLIWDSKKNIKLTSYLYPEIAKLNDDAPNRVERAIRHAFEVARGKRGNKEAVEYYIGMNNAPNSESLAMLHLRIKNMEETE